MAWIVLLWWVSAAMPARAGGFDVSVLPRCWSVTSTYEADGATLGGFGQRFSANLKALSNVKIDAGGIPLQVNLVTCASDDDAAKVYEYFMSARNASPLKYVRRANLVYEFLCDNRGVLGKIHEALGLYPRYESSYKVTMDVAPIVGGDDTKWNTLFNALLAAERDPGDENAARVVRELAAAFQFGNAITLRAASPTWGAPTCKISPAPETKERRGDVLHAGLPELERVHGVPRVTIEATVPVRAFSVYRPEAPVNAYELTRATDSWPVDSPELDRAFESGWDPDATTLEKVEYLSCWVFENIAYAGDDVGSRYGMLQTLAQGYGHCWDKSDVFVSLCRRVGIPAREVMGWQLVFNQGHVWAEVYDESSGWISVDPSASWIGVDELYVPLFLLEDGRAPFIYTSMPRVEPQPSTQKTGDTH